MASSELTQGFILLCYQSVYLLLILLVFYFLRIFLPYIFYHIFLLKTHFKF